MAGQVPSVPEWGNALKGSTLRFSRGRAAVALCTFALRTSANCAKKVCIAAVVLNFFSPGLG
jgi:hypothetical protein